MLHRTKSFIKIIVNTYQRSFSAALTEGQIIQRPVEVQLHFSAVSQRKVQSKSPLCTLPEVLLYWSPPENMVWTFLHVHHLGHSVFSCPISEAELVPEVTYFFLSCGSGVVHPSEWGLLYPLLSHFRIPLSCGWLRQLTVILLFSIQHAHISPSQHLNHIILQNCYSRLMSRGRFHIWFTSGGLGFATWSKVADGLLLTKEALHRHRRPSVWKLESKVKF